MKKTFFKIIFSTVVFTALFAGRAFGAEATRLDSKVSIKDKTVEISGYDINGRKCFKIRDIAAMTGDLPYRFSVKWDEENFLAHIEPGISYEGGLSEEKPRAAKAEYCEKPLVLSIYDMRFEIPGYNIDGRFYVSAKDIGDIMGFRVSWDNENKTLAIGQGDREDIKITADIYAPAPKKLLALTFDDGPQPGSTEVILDSLDAVGGHATFFVVGSRAAEYPDLIKKINEQGSQIGNHSYDHTQLSGLGTDAIAREVNRTSQAVFDSTGEYTRIGRPPYGAISSAVKTAVDIEWFNWNVDTLDWKYRDPDYVYEYVISHAKDGDTILMHDLHKTTAEAMKRAIPKLDEMGFELVSIDEMADLKGGYENVKGHL